MTDPPVLTQVALNRATLARQLLLCRVAMDPVTAVGALGGLQAQEPASPFLALWARLDPFDPGELRAAFEDRRLVKATLMRSTLHTVPAADYRLLRPALAPVQAATGSRNRGERPDDGQLIRLQREALAQAAIPRRNSDLRDHVAALHGDTDAAADDTWWWVRRHLALVHAPAGGAWVFDRRPHLVDAEAWLEGDGGFATEEDGLRHLVRRYLGAFGPASVADAASWSRLPVGRLRPAFASLAVGGETIELRDGRGRALVDLVDAPRPEPSTPAPPRLLPMWDSILLAHADRTRIISDEDRARVVDVNGDTYPAFLVDGRVAGLWWARVDGGAVAIDLEPFRPLDDAARAGLEAEGARLASFLGPLERDVYRRFRTSRARRLAGRQDLRAEDP